MWIWDPLPVSHCRQDSCRPPGRLSCGQSASKLPFSEGTGHAGLAPSLIPLFSLIHSVKTLFLNEATF